MPKLYRAGGHATSGFWLGHGRSARNPLSGLANGRSQTGPGWLVGGELLAEIGHELVDLIVAHAVLEGWHVAEMARGGGCDAVQDHLDQIVRQGAVQIAVQRQRRPAAEQRRAADGMAHRAGALIETRANDGCRNGPGAR